MKSIKKYISACCIISVSAISLGLIGCGLQEVVNYDPVVVASPKGDCVVVWYYRNAGATTSEVTAMIVAPKGAKWDLDTPALVINEKLSTLPLVEWKSETSTIIRIDGTKLRPGDIFIKTNKQAGVSIEYKTR